MNSEDIINTLRTFLTPERFEHTLGVAKWAKYLALLNGVSPEKAYTAALLHDCAKCFTKEELKSYIKKYNIELDASALSSPQLWHSYVGAFVAKDVYGISDKEITDAIYYHTTGKAGMSDLCAIIYLADAIEDGRNYKGVEELRTMARESLWDAVYAYTERSAEFIKSKGCIVHPDTFDLLNRRQK